MASVRAAVERIRPRGVILLYHRVTELARDPQWLAVSPEEFGQHLEVLKDYATVLPLEELAQRAEKDDLPRRAAAVTFDDGYADNLLQAAPLLKAHDVPATVFVATGRLRGESEFWWDELERLLLETPELPDRLTVAIAGEEHGWDLGPTAPLPGPDQWNVKEKSFPSSRHRAYRELTALVQRLDHKSREGVLNDLAAKLRVSRSVRESHRIMTPDEVRLLGKDDRITVGAHTVTHSMLAAISPEEQAAEIRESKNTLEETVGKAVRTFSYPFGGRGTFTAETISAVRKTGFDCACANSPGWVTRSSDPFQLPRFIPRNWDRDTFEDTLDLWFRG